MTGQRRFGRKAGRRMRSVLARKLRHLARYFQTPLTGESIAADLRALGLKAGDTVMVHSSLGRLGWVAGGARTVIEAFLSVLTEAGTLVMPAYSAHGTMLRTLESGAVFDVRTTPSRVGAVTEAFRRYPGVVRSLHPTSSVAAWGRHASQIVAGHERGELMAGPGTPFQKLLEFDAVYMGMGVDLRIVSLYHVLEDNWDGFPVRVHSDRTFAAPVVDAQGRKRMVTVRPLDPLVARTRIDQPDSAWLRRSFCAHFTTCGIVRPGRVGRAAAWAAAARAFYDELRRLAERGMTIYGRVDRGRLDNPPGLD